MNLVKDILCFFFCSLFPTRLRVFSGWVLRIVILCIIISVGVRAQCAAYAGSWVCVCESENVHTGVVLSVFVCIMLLPTQVLRPQKKSIANNSTATGKEPYHPRGLWDRVYNQRWSVGGWNLLGWPCVMLYIVSSFSLKNCQALS